MTNTIDVGRRARSERDIGSGEEGPLCGQFGGGQVDITVRQVRVLGPEAYMTRRQDQRCGEGSGP